MARPIGRGRTIVERLAVSKYSVPQDLAPKEIVFFHPPKGIDVVTPLAYLPPELSPYIANLLLDKGVLRSRAGVEKYHNGNGALRLLRTVDFVGTQTQLAPVTVDRTTLNQGVDAGWSGAGINSLSLSATNSWTDSVPAGSAIFCTIGDPTPGSNVDAWNDLYAMQFIVKADRGNMVLSLTDPLPHVIATVVVQYSTDGGTTWTNAGTYEVDSGDSSNTVTFSPSVTVPGSPTQLQIRLMLSAAPSSDVTSGTGSASVQAFATVFGTDTYPITWTTQTSSSVPDRFAIRFDESTLMTYDDSMEPSDVWHTAYSFPVNQINNDFTLPSYAVWNDTIVITDIGDASQVGAGNPIGSKGLVSIATASPYAGTILPKSPRAAHITIFGNRVVASRVNEWNSTTDPWVQGGTFLTRVRWCAKDDNTKWDPAVDIGAGFEDLSVPGGNTDEVMGVYPVSDQTAIVVSLSTIRRMDVTGFADAPFQFALLTQSLGTSSRYTIQAVPGGVIFLGNDDVYLVSLGDVKRLGTNALRDSIAKISNPRVATAYFDPNDSHYHLEFLENGVQVVWNYSFLDGGWTRTVLPFDIVFIDRAVYKVNGIWYRGNYFTMSKAGGFSCRDNPTRTQDVDITGANVDSKVEIRTGYILSDTPLRKTELIEVQLVYEASVTQQLYFEYSVDGGNTWSLYSSTTVNATDGPAVLSVRHRLETEALQLRVRSPALGQLVLESLHAFIVRGALIHP